MKLKRLFFFTVETPKKQKQRSTPISKPISRQVSESELQSGTPMHLPARLPTPSSSQTKPNLTTAASCSSGFLISQNSESTSAPWQVSLKNSFPISVLKKLKAFARHKKNARMRVRMRTQQTPNLNVPAQTCRFSRFLLLEAS